MSVLDVKRQPDGRVLARRKDGRPLTPEDHQMAKKMIDREDPILTVEQWLPEFLAFHRQVVREIPDFDWGWIREHRPETHKALRTKEAEIDALREAPLSRVMRIMREWRDIVLNAEFERKKAGSADVCTTPSREPARAPGQEK
jgi:hypothetical protein